MIDQAVIKITFKQNFIVNKLRIKQTVETQNNAIFILYKNIWLYPVCFK